jgi:hypothetical protein
MHMSMRINTDGKFSHREETIERASAYLDCNKSAALLRSADAIPRIGDAIVDVLERDDLTRRQRREIAETLSIPGTLEVSIEEDVDVDVE